MMKIGMNPDVFSSDEQEILRACIGAIKYLPIYGEDDFRQMFGLSKTELNEVEDSFPNWDLYDEGAGKSDDSMIALSNAFAWIIDGADKDRDILMKHIPYNQDSIAQLYDKFRNL